MYNLNHSNAGLSQAAFISMIRMRAKYQPEKIAFNFIPGKNDQKRSISYYELDKNIRRIASLLQGKKLRGERAILLFPDGKDFVENFFGCLYAGVIAVPVFPPEPSKLISSLQRIKGIINDSQARVVLTSSRVMEMIQSAAEYADNTKKYAVDIPQQAETLKGLVHHLVDTTLWLQTDNLSPGGELLWNDPGINIYDTAYIQYTSGSTGSPKGVIITHENILVNSRMKADAFEVTSEWECVSWLPVYHDMGLVGGILQPLYSGFTCTLMPTSAFLVNPLRWLKIISEIKDKPVVSGGPNFAYDLCCRRISSVEISSLDLSNWEVAFNGAEPVRAGTLENFYGSFKTAGFRKETFYPCYGLAEATLFVSGGKKSEKPVTIKISKTALENNMAVLANSEDYFQFVGCGYPRVDGIIRIVDPETKELCKPDQIGEVWFSSKTSAKGYWNNKDDSYQTFNALINGNPEQLFLRTGDLGFIKDNQLFITGRLKDLIIIHGKNHYPQDIEFTVENCHPLVRQNSTAVFSVDEDEKEKLIVAAEINSGSRDEWEKIVDKIRESISIEHDLSVSKILLIKPKKIFKTTSGKIQRSAVKSAYINQHLDYMYEFTSGGNRIENLMVGNKFSEVKTGYNEIAGWLVNRLADLIKTNPAEIDIHKAFSGYGIDSLMAVELASELERETGKKISSTIVWEYSSIDRLAKSLSDQPDDSISKILSSHIQNDDKAAIVGMACRFPGADNPEEFWHLLINGIDAITEVPPDRWNIDDFYDENPDTPGKISSRHGGFLRDIDKFDPEFFGLSPREAVKMDPQQRLLLEVFWEALENSGIVPGKLAGSKTGVFIGISNHDYSQYQYGDYKNIDVYGGTGNSFSIAANRISYLYDLRGPSLPIDTACSSSLTAIHLAVKSLLSGESDCAAAGGVNLIISPEVSIAFTKGRMLAPDGHCKTFDAKADGYVRSEGCGVVILKRLSDAVRDGNEILAVIKGTAINQDGRSNGLTAPNKTAQVQVISDALKSAKVSVNDVGYIETHGTGTVLGDPVEVEAISEVFKNRTDKYPLVIGSVKTNIGHLESAAGMAGIIKTILMMKNKWIPANLHFNKLNPYIKLDQSKIRIAGTKLQWDTDNERRIAGISAFGFGGVNTHVVLEEYYQKNNDTTKADRPLNLLTISAKDENSLIKQAGVFKNYLINTNNPVSDICYTANSCRTNFEYRLAVSGKDNFELSAKINSFLNGEITEDIYKGNNSEKNNFKTVMLFTGQGSQYINMGKVLYETHPFFREILNKCNNILNRFLDKPILNVIFSNDPSELNNTCYTQPALFIIEYAIAKLWLSWGIKPDYLIGHSIGEYCAACIAEVFPLDEALMLVSTRAKLMQSLPLNGGMAVVFSDSETVKAAINGYEERISIAGINGPLNTVISGEKEIIGYITKQLKGQGIHSRLLNVSHAFHSPLMQPILNEFEKTAEKIEYQSPKIPIVSNLTGKLIDSGSIFNAVYWRDQIRYPVLFAEGMTTLSGVKAGIFIETGPNPVLIGMGKNCLPEQKLLWFPSLKNDKDDWHVILESLSQLYVKGTEINWDGFHQGFTGGLICLPNYSFKKNRYWIDTSVKKTVSTVNESRPNLKSKIGPLVHSRITSSLFKEIVYESEFTPKEYKIFDDHRIFDKSVMPAAGYIEMVLEILNAIRPAEEFRIENLEIHEPAVIKEATGNRFQTILEPSGDEIIYFKVFSLSDIKNGSTNPEWKLNVSGRMFFFQRDKNNNNFEKFDFDSNGFNAGSNKNINEFYDEINNTGINYGNAFTVLKQIWAVNNEALGYAVIDKEAALPNYEFHPALLDAGFQLLSAVFNENHIVMNYDQIMLPVGFDSFQIFNKKNIATLWIRASLSTQPDHKSNEIFGDIKWYDDDGNIYAEMTGLKLRCTGFEVLSYFLNINPGEWFYEVYWKKQEVQKIENPVKKNWIIIEENIGIGDKLAEHFSGKGDLCRLVQPGKSFTKINEQYFEIDNTGTDDYQKLFDEINQEDEKNIYDVVYLCSSNEKEWGLNSLDEVETHQLPLYKNLLEIIKQLIGTGSQSFPRLWVITFQSQNVNDNPKNINLSSLGGFIKVAANELPELNCKLIDFDGTTDENILMDLIAELESWDNEENVAYRNKERYVPRLKRKNNTFPDHLSANDLIRLEIRERGSINSLEYVKTKRINPRGDEVEIEVKASGLNFRDIMNVLGLYPGDAGLPGNECSGIITSVGESVKNFKPDDEVFGIAPGCFGNYTVTKESLVIHKPPNINFIEGSTIPIAFLTAYYALNKLAKISSKDRILIHSAAGGVGLAAIQIAQLAGAEIYATAGNDYKREYLKSLGVKFLMNSRSQNFAPEVIEYSGGKGVTIILNSLTGESIPNGLSVLSPGGCFLEIGKAGIWDKKKVKSIRDDISYFTIALDDMSMTNPALIQSMLLEIKSLIENHLLKPIKHQVFSRSEIKDAFRLMMKAEHIGKIVISDVGRQRNLSSNNLKINRSSSYLITGGFGELGLKTAEWLSAKNAGQIILLGRSETSEYVEKRVEIIKSRGTKVISIKADVSSMQEFSTAMDNLLAGTNPLFALDYPIKGIIHAAGVIDDGIILKQTSEKFGEVLRPKINGAINIHNYFKNMSLDFIIYYSSISSLLGTPGQSNYAAANSFLDAFSHYQRKKGINAISINWCPWKNTGMARKILKENIFYGILEPVIPNIGFIILDKVLEENLTQTCIMNLHDKYFDYGQNNIPRILTDLLDPKEYYGRGQFNKSLHAESERKYLSKESKNKVMEIIHENIIKILSLNKCTNIEITKPLHEMGLDSLMAIELKNEIRNLFGIDLPMTVIFNNPTIDSISDYLMEH